jgi:hypothetical protein
MPECPSHLVSVPFYISLPAVVGTEYLGDVSCHGRLFGYANYHSFLSFLYLLRGKVTVLFGSWGIRLLPFFAIRGE